ncbi:unnamed protein product [Cylindrotheca closterium]|uniref:Uncharacterized protein n=1 Tax=Cylindrotheca closterium TaxID=2856 RepID=A0AAD2FHG0_9STRA|nr:unnamed protein product [Cylindrotheca closterium]
MFLLNNRHNNAQWLYLISFTRPFLEVLDEFIVGLVNSLFNVFNATVFVVHVQKVRDGLEVYIPEDNRNWTQIRHGGINKDAIHQVGLYSASPNLEDDREVFLRFHD